jgi:hypothetical protein
MPTELEMQIETVREARARRELAGETMKLAYARFDREEADNLRILTTCREVLTAEEDKLRELTLAAYAETGNKKPADGVGIRIVKEITCDEAEAVKWAVDAKALNCLSLQKANFKKVAEGLALPFVEIKEVATATIAKEI